MPLTTVFAKSLRETKAALHIYGDGWNGGERNTRRPNSKPYLLTYL